MSDRNDQGVPSDRQVGRRSFLKAAGTAGAAATMLSGIEGILAVRRAPAFAQAPSSTSSAGWTSSRRPTSS
jgi:hypothetical protein